MVKINKILIETSLGELIDKISILEIKIDKIEDKTNKEEITKEYTSLTNALTKIKLSSNERTRINDFIIKLKEINIRLWNVENEKRLAEKNKNFDKKFIEHARNVYKLNDERAKVKRQVNESFGSNIKEVKKYTEY
jgi:proline dehydrogenase